VRRSSHLSELKEQATRRCVRLEMLVEDARTPLDSQQSRHIAFVSIELLNLWAGFCRAYYLSCALGTKDSDGTRVVHPHFSVGSLDDAIALAVHKVDKRTRSRSGPFGHYDEPSWHTLSQFQSVMRELNPSNLANVDAAVSQPNQVLRDLPAFRNFFAHRGESTATKTRDRARAYLVDPNQHPAEILASYPSGKSRTVLTNYLHEVRYILRAM